MATRPSSLTTYDRATPQERAAIREACLRIACFDCGAHPGQRCHGSAGKSAQPHWIRRKQAFPTEPTTDQRLAALEDQIATIRGFLNI